MTHISHVKVRAIMIYWAAIKAVYIVNSSKLSLDIVNSRKKNAFTNCKLTFNAVFI